MELLDRCTEGRCADSASVIFDELRASCDPKRLAAEPCNGGCRIAPLASSDWLDDTEIFFLRSPTKLVSVLVSSEPAGSVGSDCTEDVLAGARPVDDSATLGGGGGAAGAEGGAAEEGGGI
jgi:hypothetical protein